MKNGLRISGIILSFAILLASCGGHSGGTAVVTGVTTTLAGQAGVPGSTDGTGTAATFHTPYGLATDGTSIFVADTGNSTIRKIDIASGLVSTLTGSAGVPGSTDGTGTAALFQAPCGITTDGTNLYVTDTGNNTIRQVVISTGVVTTLAGQAGVPGSTDGTGTAATFQTPIGIVTNGPSLFVADTGNSTIRGIDIASGAVQTVAGQAGVYGSTDGTGSAAFFNHPVGITMYGTVMVVADTGNNTIRFISSAAVVTTFVGSAGVSGSTDGTGAAALFNHPAGVATDGTYLYITDTGNNTIRKVIISTDASTTLAGVAEDSGSDDGTGAAARFYRPVGIAEYNAILYVADTLNSTVRRVQ